MSALSRPTTATPAAHLRRRPTKWRPILVGSLAMLVALVVFVIPFLFIAVQAVKNRRDASRLSFAWPSEWQLWRNFWDVIQERDYMLLLAYFNSTLITVCAVALLVVFAAMVGFVLQRRRSRWNAVVMGAVLAGLMIPPAVVPTIWVLQGLGLFKTIHGMILIEVAYNLSFSILLYRAFIATIPRELDEAAIIDGAGPWRIYWSVILPLAIPALTTAAIFTFIWTWDDFFGPLIYLSDIGQYTVQLGLRSFVDSTGKSDWSALFAMSVVALIPVLLFFVIFQRLLIEGIATTGMKG